MIIKTQSSIIFTCALGAIFALAVNPAIADAQTANTCPAPSRPGPPNEANRAGRDRVWQLHQNFRRQAASIQRDEPFLYDSPMSNTPQGRWTKKNQGYIRGQSLNFQRISNLRENASLQQLKLEYGRFGQRASTLLSEIYPNFEFHRDQHTEQSSERRYVEDFSQALRGILPAENTGELPNYTQMQCDYVSQPVNALWYSVNSMRLIDLQGKELYGEAWDCEREKLHQENKIPSLTEFRERLSRGLPYVTPERFRHDGAATDEGENQKDASSVPARTAE